MNSPATTPHGAASESSWYAFINGEIKGPFDRALLQEMFCGGLIEEATLLARAGTENWVPVSDLLAVQSLAALPQQLGHVPARPGPIPTGNKNPEARLASLAEQRATAGHWIAGVTCLALLLLVAAIWRSPGRADIRAAQHAADHGNRSERDSGTTYDTPELCARCNGTGQISSSGRPMNWNSHPDPSERLKAGSDQFRCATCGGEGTIHTQSGHVVSCPDCSGRGRAASRACEVCGGTGRVR